MGRDAEFLALLKNICIFIRQMKKVIPFLFAFWLCACSKHIPSVYEVVGMSLGNANNAGEEPADATTASVPKQAYAIKMTLSETMLKKTEGDAEENGFINDDRLTSLNIFSLNNFDAAHPAGASLNAYFLTGLSSSATIDAFISKGQIGAGKYENGSYTDNWSTNQYLYLMTPPASAGSQSFVVKIELSDGRSMSDTVNINLY